ncbi:hypothetical protein Q7370_10680 [Glaesserella parasuis]|uniref:hypothetical protein n=2 Tax=Glaesserella parasuis TaxID=738 RepID=UPI0003ABDDE4|nr:hypothetical protein [Glaesserella parasuis]EQA09888.1 hypothetical protein HPSH465_1010 [Glaesserella parasuis H465]MDG6242701.1 hypothetical protein [Glaesserella parasuis]MDG6295795.1 hypothetical protein [Glaesserella parasuis]MDG6792164.1 hypothetical protein [Glaesserella parasuis]MDO9819611.1 hypothetical protein [Glaesserella parasuis]
MKRFSLLPLGLLFVFPTMAFAAENNETLLEQEVLTGKTTTETSVDLNEDLDQATSGLGHFRFGFSAGGGYYKSVSVDNYPNMSGFSGELGVYTLFNPIRDWADVELGVRTLYVFPHDSKSKNSETGTVKQKSYSGLNSGSIYDGLVFRFLGASSAIAAGVYQDFVAKSQFSEKHKQGTDFKNKLKYKPGQGVYAEYQWIGSQNGDNLPLIPFARFTYGTFKSEYQQSATEVQTNREKLFGLALGVKF